MARLRDWPMTAMRHVPDSGGSTSPSSDDEDEGTQRTTGVLRRAKIPRDPDDTDSVIGPGGPKSLSGIALRAFLLGTILGVSLLLTLYLLAHAQPSWRGPFFLCALCAFHFLEFHVTAAHNTRQASVDSFLLTTNGLAYNAAHTAALLETLIGAAWWPDWQVRFGGGWWGMALGLGAMGVGQVVRTVAMARAGRSFNHTVQTRRGEGHELVTAGVYGWLRHPSYFGFWWWALGAQVVLGNAACLVVYACVLWGFFATRIRNEEEFLIRFFGKEYEDYRARTPVGIPFIW